MLKDSRWESHKTCLKLLFNVVKWHYGINTGSKKFVPAIIGRIAEIRQIVVEEKKTSFHIKGSGAAFAGVHPRKAYFILNIVSAAPIRA